MEKYGYRIKKKTPDKFYQEHVQMAPRGCKLLVHDHSMWSGSKVFCPVMTDLDHLTTEQNANIQQRYAKYALDSRTQPDLVIYLRLSPEFGLQNLQPRGHPNEEGIMLDYLERLHDAHESWLEHGDFHCHVPKFPSK